MAEPKRKPLYPNPFYVLLVLASTAFVLTVLGYLIAPMIHEKARNLPAGAAPPSPGSLALAGWFDRWSVTAITIEIVVMTATSLLAMVSDRWFPSKAESD